MLEETVPVRLFCQTGKIALEELRMGVAGRFQRRVQR